MNRLVVFRTLFSSTVVAGTLVAAVNAAEVDASLRENPRGAEVNLVALQFALPNDAAPKTSTGGGVRGSVQFALPSQTTAPKTSTGGGVRGDVQFALPGQTTAPKTSTGGGVRGDVQFALPGQTAAPKTSTGGGVRGDVQFTLPGQTAAPSTSTGGGVRGDVQFALPGQTTAPSTSTGGGVRGKNIPLTALIPSTQIGRTASARPTIYAFLPALGAQEVFFSLQDREGNSHYHAVLNVPTEGGVIGITLPESMPELALGMDYLWYFAPIEPGGFLRPDNYAVTGWVVRVEADVDREQSATSPVQLATAYATAGIWYDTLQTLVTAQAGDPNNATLTGEWRDLLEQVGLADIAEQPIITLPTF